MSDLRLEVVELDAVIENGVERILTAADVGVECDNCDGEGEIMHECECGDEHYRDCIECSGDGLIRGSANDYQGDGEVVRRFAIVLRGAPGRIVYESGATARAARAALLELGDDFVRRTFERRVERSAA